MSREFYGAAADLDEETVIEAMFFGQKRLVSYGSTTLQ